MAAIFFFFFFFSSCPPKKSMFTDGGHSTVRARSMSHYWEKKEERRGRQMWKRNRFGNKEVMERQEIEIKYGRKASHRKRFCYRKERKKKVCSYLHSLPDIWKQIVRNIYFPSSYSSLHLDSISQNNELREKDCHQSQSFSVSPRSICQYFPINLVRLKYAIIYAPLRLEVHVIRDKLILEFQNAWMLFSKSRKQKQKIILYCVHNVKFSA